jgi:hypothetical protein
MDDEEKSDGIKLSSVILILILFIIAVEILNFTLEHFGITKPFEERDPYRKWFIWLSD